MKHIARFLMWLGGWKFVGRGPDVPKAVIISVPHTSNWDLFGRTGIPQPGGAGVYPDEERVFLFPAGDAPAGVAGAARGPRQEGQPTWWTSW